MQQRKQLITRPTAIALAFKEALERIGIDTTDARMPLKREPTWTVSRRNT
jgi:hypothetical protein